MKVRDFIKEEWDMDIYNDVTTDWGIAFCGPLELTEEGESEWDDVLDYNIDVYEVHCEAIVHVDGPDGVWQKLNRRAKRFFYAAAGYCSCEDYEKWFVE